MIAYQIVFYWNVECLKWIFEFLVTVFSYNLKQGFINYLLQLYATTSSSAIVGGCTHLALSSASTWGRTLNRWSAAVLILCVSMNQSRAPSLPTALSVSFEERKIITERERESDGLVWMGLGWYFFLWSCRCWTPAVHHLWSVGKQIGGLRFSTSFNIKAASVLSNRYSLARSIDQSASSS